VRITSPRRGPDVHVGRSIALPSRGFMRMLFTLFCPHPFSGFAGGKSPRPPLLTRACPLGLSLAFFAALFLSGETAHAQMSPFPSVRYGLTAYSKDRLGLYFPTKDPEEQEITVGGVIVRPGVGLKESYSSNITLSENDKKNDFITDVAPALMLEIPYRRHTFDIEYVGVLTYYRDNPFFDADNHFIQARAQLLGLRDTLQINVRHLFGVFYTPTEDIPNVTDEDAQLFNRRRGLNYYQSTATVLYRKDLFSAHAEYTNEINVFHRDIDKRDDSDGHRALLFLGYNLRPKTRLLLGYTFEHLDGAQKGGLPSIDHNEHGLVYGFELQVLKKVEAQIRGTYNWLDYQDLGIELDYPGAWVNVSYRFLERCTLYFSFQRMTKPSYFYTGQREKGGFFYIETNGSASLEYQFRRNILLWSSLLYRNFRYPEQFRRLDDQYGGIVQLIYSLRPWLRLGAIQGYTINQSTLQGQDFEEMRTQLYVQSAF
jgi:hypothetical protein